MSEHDQTEDKLPAAEAKQEAAQASDTKVEATDTVKASQELSEEDLEAVAGGRDHNTSPTDKPVRIGPSYYDKPKL